MSTAAGWDRLRDVDEPSPRYLDALVCAAHLHAGQVRKARPSPYLSHVLAVSALVIEDGGSEDEAIAALLHDALEDHGDRLSLDDLRHRFGDTVADIVWTCTDAVAGPHDAKAPWVSRKAHHLLRLTDAPALAMRVLAADKLHNVEALLTERRLGDVDVWARFNGRLLGTMWYYRQMVELLERRPPLGTSVLPRRLALAVDDLDRHAREDLRRPDATVWMAPPDWPPAVDLATPA